MQDSRSRWQRYYTNNAESGVKALFTYVERIIVGTVVISAGAHISSTAPGIAVFGYLRHSLVGLGLEIFGAVLLSLNFIDGLSRLHRHKWHTGLQITMAVIYFVLSARLVELILAFRGE